MKDRDRIVGMFLGVAVGDALGKQVEGCSASYIAENFGRITGYVRNGSHKWFGDDSRGTTTDDWQLTAATAEGIIRTGKVDMTAIAACHTQAYTKSVNGWGSTTREAVGKLLNGAAWQDSGKTTEPKRGTGNGVCMKVSPLGAHMAVTNPLCQEPEWSESLTALKQFARMTHYTRMGVQSGISHAFAVFKCLTADPDDFRVDSFVSSVVAGALAGGQVKRDEDAEGTDDLQDRLRLLYRHPDYNAHKIVTDFGAGSCYIFDSLPFTYMFFVKNPGSIESLYDCVSAGGDADSNGSMLASLLGALHGTSIFPQTLVDNLAEKEAVFDVANRFCDALKVK